ncbi:hypothetical protein TNCV_371301 [Trichonephila clavipes]|nr:hypothetical protein TNCV_371301 [Trichonephila clavipes]
MHHQVSQCARHFQKYQRHPYCHQCRLLMPNEGCHELSPDICQPDIHRVQCIGAGGRHHTDMAAKRAGSLAATPSQWRYTPKSCSVVRRKRASLGSLQVLRDWALSGQFPMALQNSSVFLGHGSFFVNVCGDDALLRVKGTSG